MGYTRLSPSYPQTLQATPRRLWVHIGLFLLTLVSTIMAGTQWAGLDGSEILNWGEGLLYATLIMGFLSAHEFGHYIAARRHGVDATLPYFIPVPFVFLFPFGTMGALIKTRSAIMSRKALFDIGVSGPIAGFVMCVIYLAVGFATLPPIEYLYQIHPEYRAFGGAIPVYGLYFGDTILYSLMQSLFASSSGFVPPMNEVYHYPFLNVGWFGLFVTALNLLPMGQLDGGHITYAMFGKGQGTIARWVWVILVVLGMAPIFEYLLLVVNTPTPDALMTTLQDIFGPVLRFIDNHAHWYFSAWSGWLLWALIGRFIVKLDHPALDDDEPLDKKRMAIGWLAILIFLLSFSFNGLYEIPQTQENAVPTNVKKSSMVEVR